MGFFSATYFGLSATGSSIVVVDNAIVSPLVIGDDYFVLNERGLVFDYALPPDVTSSSTVWFEGRHRYDARYSWLVQGAISFPTVDTMRLTFNLPGSATALLIPGEYIYQLYVVTDSGQRISPAASIERPVDLIGIPSLDVAC